MRQKDAYGVRLSIAIRQPDGIGYTCSMVKRPLFLVLASAVVFAAGCTKEIDGETGTPFVLKVNQKAAISDPLHQRTLMVEFDEVVEDSRCPEGAMCFWAGQAIVAVSINGEQLKLMVADSDSAWVGWKDYRVRCKVLSPYPTVKDKTGKNPNKRKEAMLEIK